jgi:probable addiction module antidote protein
MAVEVTPFDAADYLDSDEAQARFLADAIEEGDPAYIAHALGIVARARGMTKIARDAGLAREALYRSLSADGDPRLSTLFGVLKSLGVTLTVAPNRPPG